MATHDSDVAALALRRATSGTCGHASRRRHPLPLVSVAVLANVLRESAIAAPDRLFDLRSNAVESFDSLDGLILRRIGRRDGSVSESAIAAQETPDLPAAFDAAWLRSTIVPRPSHEGSPLRVVDLFCGCGGLTLGLQEAARALGRDLDIRLAVDFADVPLGVYARNFASGCAHHAPVERFFDGEVGFPPTARERRVQSQVGEVDVLVGGPPCQGHSDLNNHTRRNDPKNRLYLRMVRAAEVLRPTHVIVENVPGVVHSTNSVVQAAKRDLRRLGYAVDGGVLHAADLGVAQKRRRYCLVASRSVLPSLRRVADDYRVPERSLGWAISAIRTSPGTAYDTAAVHAAVNRQRIDFLFDHDLHELPDSERPDCHRLKAHSYRSVYGRMWWDRPAPTITSGFGSTGQGRFVHPRERRTLTPHEAARVQFFPDYFDFGEAGRVALQEMIGNAVPPKLGYVLGVDLLR